MKEIYKNQILYYILVPVFIGLWPLLVWAVYLPRAERQLNSDTELYEKAQKNIESILAIDPERLQLAGEKPKTAEFDYVNEVYRVAALSGIPQGNCKLNSGIIMTSGDQKSQSAKVTFKEVDVVKFAEFLSTIQLRWADLQCTKIQMTKKKGLLDTWDVDLVFNYYY